MPRLNWYKGNIHTHTTESDGDETPERVVRWYRRNGYDFLVLSDHNHLTLFEYGRGRRRFKRPLMIPGEEVSVNLYGGSKRIHINAIGISSLVEPIDATDVVPTIAGQRQFDRGGRRHSLHQPSQLLSGRSTTEQIAQVTGATLLEVFNGHPAVNVYGAPGRPSYEEIWDGVLSAGRPIYGVATDDSHNYKEFRPDLSNPGRGWLMVRADEAVARCDFRLHRVGRFLRIDRRGPLRVEGCRAGDVPEHGATLRWPSSRRASSAKRGMYTPRSQARRRTTRCGGDEGYVRASVTSSTGPRAWTQPLFPS